jgi:hypothetical protein
MNKIAKFQKKCLILEVAGQRSRRLLIGVLVPLLSDSERTPCSRLIFLDLHPPIFPCLWVFPRALSPRRG